MLNVFSFSSRSSQKFVSKTPFESMLAVSSSVSANQREFPTQECQDHCGVCWTWPVVLTRQEDVQHRLFDVSDILESIFGFLSCRIRSTCRSISVVQLSVSTRTFSQLLEHTAILFWVHTRMRTRFCKGFLNRTETFWLLWRKEEIFCAIFPQLVNFFNGLSNFLRDTKLHL
jgi:hypothetical protein